MNVPDEHDYQVAGTAVSQPTDREIAVYHMPENAARPSVLFSKHASPDPFELGNNPEEAVTSVKKKSREPSFMRHTISSIKKDNAERKDFNSKAKSPARFNYEN